MYVVGTHYNCLGEAILMSANNIGDSNEYQQCVFLWRSAEIYPLINIKYRPYLLF